MTIHSFVASFHVGVVALLIGFFAWHTGVVAWSQVVGDEAEMDRLKAKAEDAIANDDAEGAAMSMGRAALMAAELAKRNTSGAHNQLYRGAEALYRSQEHAYRALALFRRAGEQLPASSGVCGSLSFAHNHVQQALKLLDQPSSNVDDQKTDQRIVKLKETAEDWVTVIASMHTEYQCL